MFYTVLGSPPLEGWLEAGVVNHMTLDTVTTINEVPIGRCFTRNLPYNPGLKSRARALRKSGVLSEVIFWQQVHKKKFYGVDFDRQKIIGNYIVDFYYKALSLIVEIDGSSHDNKEEYDQKRESFSKSLGLKIFKTSD